MNNTPARAMPKLRFPEDEHPDAMMDGINVKMINLRWICTVRFDRNRWRGSFASDNTKGEWVKRGL